MAWFQNNRFKYLKVESTFPQSQKFEGLQPAANCEQDGVCANSQFIALPLSRTASLAVLPAYGFKRFSQEDVPLIVGHKGNITDCAFSPFKADLLATASEDATCKLWLLPENGIKENLTKCDGNMQGHGKKVTGLVWHNSAENILATSSFDQTIRVWDIENEESTMIY